MFNQIKLSKEYSYAEITSALRDFMEYIIHRMQA